MYVINFAKNHYRDLEGERLIEMTLGDYYLQQVKLANILIAVFTRIIIRSCLDIVTSTIIKREDMN